MSEPYQPSKTRAASGLYTALPTLPRDWKWIQSPHDWLVARSPRGLDYYVDFNSRRGFMLTRRARATRWDWVRTLGKLKPGAEYADAREVIHSHEL